MLSSMTETMRVPDRRCCLLRFDEVARSVGRAYQGRVDAGGEKWHTIGRNGVEGTLLDDQDDPQLAVTGPPSPTPFSASTVTSTRCTPPSRQFGSLLWTADAVCWAGGAGTVPQMPKRDAAPVEGAVGDHEHHRHQRRHRYL